MFHGSAHTRPADVAADAADGKYGESPCASTNGERSSSHPARANSGTQIRSSIMTSNPALAPSRLIA